MAEYTAYTYEDTGKAEPSRKPRRPGKSVPTKRKPSTSDRGSKR